MAQMQRGEVPDGGTRYRKRTETSCLNKQLNWFISQQKKANPT